MFQKISIIVNRNCVYITNHKTADVYTIVRLISGNIPVWGIPHKLAKPNVGLTSLLFHYNVPVNNLQKTHIFS